MAITIERNEKGIQITIPSTINPIELQHALSYFKFIDIVDRSKATQEDINHLAKSVKSAMSKEIIEKLKQLEEFKDL